jgi:hypothetical protein
MAGGGIDDASYHHASTGNTENPIYVFSEKELRRISPNSYIHVSVNDIYSNWETELYNSVLEITRLHSFISGNT